MKRYLIVYSSASTAEIIHNSIITETQTMDNINTLPDLERILNILEQNLEEQIIIRDIIEVL